MQPWGLFCTCSPLLVMFLSRGITLSFWNGSTECDDWDFSNLSLGNDRSPFWAPQILSRGKDWDLVRQLLLHLPLTFVLSPGPVIKIFSWGVTEIRGGQDFWIGTDRKGIWYPFAMFKMEGSHVSFSQFSKKYWRQPTCGKFWDFFGGNKPFIARSVWVYFWTEDFHILLRRLILVSPYLWLLLLLRKRILDLYHLYFLLVEGLIERAGCSLASKGRLVFFVVNQWKLILIFVWHLWF